MRDALKALTRELRALALATAGDTYGDARRRERLLAAATSLELGPAGGDITRRTTDLYNSLAPVLTHRERMLVNSLLYDISIAEERAHAENPPDSNQSPVASVNAVRRSPAEQTTSQSSPAVLVLTAAPVEYRTAVDLSGVTGDLRLRRRAVGQHIFVDLGFNSCPVWLLQCKKGSVGPGSTATRTMQALMSLKPPPFAVIVTGIAFGLRPDLQTMGDVLLGEQIQLYEVQRYGSDRRLMRGDRPATSDVLLDWFRSCELDWGMGRSSERLPLVHTGLMLSGEKLVDDPDFVSILRGIEPEAIGGEMEAAGVYSAAYSRQTHWIVVKAICDWGMGKGDKYQETAARNAIDFVFHTLDQPVILEALREYMSQR